MTNDTREESSLTRKKSVKAYASKVFKESVGPVSAIVSVGNIWRKLFRVLVFLVFTGGFLYQCVEFLLYVWQYPTVVNIEMERPDKYLAPAYTFCNFNPVTRSKFCSKYPDSCYEASKELCNTYPRYCVNNNTKIPTDDISKYLEDPKSVMELIHDVRDILSGYRGQHKEKLEGPLPRSDLDGYGTAACYSLFARVNSSLEPKYRTRNE